MKQVILLLAALAAAPAFAQNVYVTGSVGNAEQNLKSQGVTLSENDTGYSAAVGYRFTPHFAIEGGYADLGNASVNFGGLSASSEPKTYYGAVVGTYPLNAQVSVSAKLGAARSSTTLSYRDGVGAYSGKEKQTSFTFGVGASYALTPSIAIVAEYQHFGKIIKVDGANLKASLLSVGARYSF
jgi:OOP family OmpA-OmpF porin